MKLLKSAGLALVLSVLGTAAFAAEDCCCKDKDGKMSCCDKMKDKADAPKAGAEKPAQPGEHQDHKH